MANRIHINNRGQVGQAAQLPGPLDLGNQNQGTNNYSSNVPEPPIGQNIDNSDAQQQRVLNNVGINSLRPEIVATTEFIPLAEDDNRNITTSNYTLNLGSLEIEVTGLTKLLEKQLIMNQTVAKNIEKFISVAAGFSLDEFLRIVKESVKDLDIPLGDIQGMKTAIVREIQNIGNLRTQSVQAVESAGRYNNNQQNGQRGRSNAGGVLNSTRNLVDDRALQQNLKKIETLFDSPYADLAFEYVARDIFIDKSIRFIDGLIVLKNNLGKSLDVGNCDVQNNLEINDQLISSITDKTQLGSSGEKPNVNFTSFEGYYRTFVAQRNNSGQNQEIINQIINQPSTKKLLTILKALGSDILLEKVPGTQGGPSLEDLTNPSQIPSFTNSRGEFEKLKKLDPVNLYFLKESRETDNYENESDFEPTFDLNIGNPYSDSKVIRQFVYSVTDFIYANNFNSKNDFESPSGLRGMDEIKYNDEVINLRSFVSKILGFTYPAVSTQTVEPYVFDDFNSTNDSISKRIVSKIPFESQNVDVVPLENNYEDLNTTNPFETGTNFFVDGALLQNDFNFTDLNDYTLYYDGKVRSLTNDYLKLHGRKRAQALTSDIDFEYIFKRFRTRLANFIGNAFVNRAPTSSEAYAFCILMVAAKNTDLANLIFRNCLFNTYLDEAAGCGENTDAKVESASEIINNNGNSDRRKLYELQSRKKLIKQLFNVVGQKLLGVSKDDMRNNSFTDRQVSEKLGSNSNLGLFPDGEDSYQSDKAVIIDALITDSVANKEERDFEDAFYIVRRLVRSSFKFDNENVLEIIDNNTNLNANFLELIFGNEVVNTVNETGEELPNSGEIPRSEKDLLKSIFGTEYRQRYNGVIGKSVQLKRSSFNKSDVDRFDNYIRSDFGTLSKTLQTSYLGRAYSYYLLMLRLLHNCLSCKGQIKKTGSNAGSKREFKFFYSKTQFSGFVDGLNGTYRGAVIVESLTGNPISPAEAAALSEELGQLGISVTSFPLKSSNFYTFGYSQVNEAISLVNNVYNGYFIGGVNHLLIMATHINGIRKNKEALRNYLDPNEQENSDQRQVVSYFTNNQTDSGNLISIMSDEQIRSIRVAQMRLFKPNAENYILPSNQQFGHPQIKNMIKYLTQPDYGYFNSEKLGRKTVLHVGIPFGLLNRLRKLSTRTTALNPTAYEKSNIVAIFIHRQNLLNPKEIVYPKTFIFDVSKFVIEDPEFQQIDNTQISEFLDNEPLQNLLNKHAIYSIKTQDVIGSSDIEAIKRTVGSAYSNPSGDNRYSSDLKLNIFKNHLTDHYLKLYNRILTGVDLQEHTFQLFDDYNLQGQQPDPDKLGLFNGDLKDKTLLLFPNANQDVSVAREYFRLHRGSSNSFLFKSKGYMDAVLQGKIFDRVFSMMINERDFIIHPDSFRPEQGTFNGNGRLSRPQSQRAFDIETPDQIYTRVPTFSLDGKLQLGNTFVKTEVKNQYRILKNYSDSLDPDSTQIYNYTVEIALLPGMIQEND